MGGNKREFFRIDIYNEEVSVYISEDADHPPIEGRMKDISGNGMSFRCSKNINFKKCLIRFRIENRLFERTSSLARKKGAEYGEYTYAVSFDAVDQKEESRLASVLLKLDALRRKK